LKFILVELLHVLHGQQKWYGHHWDKWLGRNYIVSSIKFVLTY